ncbi:MAG: Type IV secretory pathway VirB4 component-like protein [Candidatus Jorgensenbacteria bacterium GW2011_GWA1_48_13]|uniref:Type IV secretory pathway VirB4 component-like protein n=2 Tax=Candidatus Joergenseniibacteriota TaxID=1752739 RepID=A0A0G1W921_9BACT|nr:MAG: Type IV secretory pathway VirB4 component-like protein [Candidatus Jorgensenbacteria bacterium GW2011_GWA1_48_13]KKW15291.1 MAG: Type IV secretory pathway VirB4 component-like protein [Candidatus Jorgensenbacteria bacterium GW2011_GWB1_50_10]
MAEKIKIPKSYEPGQEDLPNVIAPAGMEVNSNYLKVGDYFAKTFFVFTYPRYVASGWFSPVINLAEMMDISVFVNPMDTALALRNLRKKVAQVEAEIAEKQEKGVVRDPVLETAYQDIENLRDSLQQAREKLFEVGVYITIYGSSLENLSKLENTIENLLESKLVYIKPALFRHLEGFNSVLPIAQDDLNVHTPLNSGPTSSLFPFISPDLTSDKGILYGVNLHNNSLVIFDRFSLENANSVVFAKSGSGKSYATKLEIIRSLMVDTNVIVIDPENEYQNLANAVGGSYFKISLTSPNHVNPFDIPIIPQGDEPADVFKSHILNLTGLVKLMLGEVSPEEDALLDRAITETYASRDITAENFGKITELRPPLLEDLQTILQNTEGGRTLAQRLDKFTHGSYAGFTNAPTNIDIKNRLIVFSIRDLEEELRPIAMYIVLNFVWNLVRAELKRRLLIIDEAWWMMKYKDSASFLFGLVKRARKYFLGVTTITQDVEDFLRSDFGRPIVTNSSLQFLMKQSPTSINSVAQAFNLTEGEKAFLLESAVGEGLFFAGLKHVALKVIASYTEDQIITTDPEQILEMKGIKK